MAGYNGPNEIGFADFPGRGISYSADFEGRRVQVSFSAKRQKMRIFVDGTEWTPKTDAQTVIIDGVKYAPIPTQGEGTT